MVKVKWNLIFFHYVRKNVSEYLFLESTPQSIQEVPSESLTHTSMALELLFLLVNKTAIKSFLSL